MWEECFGLFIDAPSDHAHVGRITHPPGLPLNLVLLYAFAAAVLGGLESPGGALVGGIALGIFLNLVGQYWSFVGSVLQLPVAFATLLIILLIKPTG